MVSRAAVEPGPKPEVRRHPTRTESVARLFRVFSLGATLVYVLIGIATGAAPPTPAVVVGGGLLGFAFHIFANVGNDLIDLPLDRGDPRRARGPLVRGVVTPQAALILVVAPLPMMFGLLRALQAPAEAARALAGALALIVFYNVAGKSLGIPVVADYAQGVGWALLVVTGAEVAGGATVGTLLAAAFVAVYVALINGIHGGIRDIANDTANRARTTAGSLGLQASPDGALDLPRALVVYTLAVTVVLASLFVGVVWWSLRTGSGPAPVAASGLAAGLHAASLVALARAWRARSRLRDAMAHGTWHLVLAPASLVAAILWRLPWWGAVITPVAFVAPPLVFGWVTRDLDFDLPGRADREALVRPPLRVRVAAVWEMTRPGVPASGAVLTVIGAILAGPRWPEAILAGVVAAGIVAAANVFNDRCDQQTDEINRPDRPLPSGRVSGNEVDRVVLATGVAGVAVAAAVSSSAAAAAGMLLVIAAGYSLLARPLPLGGELTVAILFALTVIFGGAFAGRDLTGIHGAAAGLILLFILAREILMGVKDRAGDRVAGYRTAAIMFGPLKAIAAFKVLVAVFAAATTIPGLMLGDGTYLLTVLTLVVAPVVGAIWSLRKPPSPESLERALHLTGVVFGTGLLPLLLLA